MDKELDSIRIAIAVGHFEDCANDRSSFTPDYMEMGILSDMAGFNNGIHCHAVDELEHQFDLIIERLNRSINAKKNST